MLLFAQCLDPLYSCNPMLRGIFAFAMRGYWRTLQLPLPSICEGQAVLDTCCWRDCKSIPTHGAVFWWPFSIAPFKAYFGYFWNVQVPSDPHRWRYFWDGNGRGPVVVLRFLERTSKYVAPSTMSYYVGRKYGQIKQGYFLEWLLNSYVLEQICHPK